MAYDEGLAERVRELTADWAWLTERKMFGGIAFMLSGNMCVGVAGERLMVRVGPDAYDAALQRPHAQPMTFTGKPMRGMVFVAAEGLADDADLRDWLEAGRRFAGSLPPKDAVRR